VLFSFSLTGLIWLVQKNNVQRDALADVALLTYLKLKYTNPNQALAD